MSFQPVVPLPGLAGWRFLQRTMDNQAQAFAKSPSVQRDTEYFIEKIGQIDTAEELVADRRLLRVALGAFGLQDDINNKYFVQKILEGGTLNDESLANKLTDDRYRAFSAAFGFGDFPAPSSKISDFGSRMVDKFLRQEFEAAIGTQDNTMRLALNAERALVDIAKSSASESTKWFRIMGNPPLREVFETALGLPTGFGQIDLDRQLEVFRERTEALTGDSGVAQFAGEDQRAALVERYLLRSQMSDSQSASSGATALSLLEGAVSFARSLRAY